MANEIISGYESGIRPSSGGEYKLLYGNREKINEATQKTYFIFSEIEDRLGQDRVALVLDSIGTCDYLAGTSGCQSTSIYSVYYDGDVSQFTYEWGIVEGNVIIEGPTDSRTVKIVSSGTVDEVFELECLVTNEELSQVTLSGTGVNYAIEWNNIVIESLSEISNTSCIYEAPINMQCEARSLYKVQATYSGDMNISWSLLDGDAYIIAGQGTDEITIGTTSRNDLEQFTLTVEIRDKFTTATESIIGTHHRAEQI